MRNSSSGESWYESPGESQRPVRSAMNPKAKLIVRRSDVKNKNTGVQTKTQGYTDSQDSNQNATACIINVLWDSALCCFVRVVLFACTKWQRQTTNNHERQTNKQTSDTTQTHTRTNKQQRQQRQRQQRQRQANKQTDDTKQTSAHGHTNTNNQNKQAKHNTQATATTTTTTTTIENSMIRCVCWVLRVRSCYCWFTWIAISTCHSVLGTVLALRGSQWALSLLSMLFLSPSIKQEVVFDHANRNRTHT